jgi:uncharacterized protein (DUF433 family)
MQNIKNFQFEVSKGGNLITVSKPKYLGSPWSFSCQEGRITVTVTNTAGKSATAEFSAEDFADDFPDLSNPIAYEVLKYSSEIAHDMALDLEPVISKPLPIDDSRIEMNPAVLRKQRKEYREKIRKLKKANDIDNLIAVLNEYYNLAVLVTFNYGSHDVKSGVIGWEADLAKLVSDAYFPLLSYSFETHGYIKNTGYITENDWKDFVKAFGETDKKFDAESMVELDPALYSKIISSPKNELSPDRIYSQKQESYLDMLKLDIELDKIQPEYFNEYRHQKYVNYLKKFEKHLKKFPT